MHVKKENVCRKEFELMKKIAINASCKLKLEIVQNGYQNGYLGS